MTESKPPVGELLPCPFCGGDASDVLDGGSINDVGCKVEDCAGFNAAWYQSGNPSHTKEGAYSKWNTRSGTYIPADDFGRILEVVKIGHKYYRDRQKCKRTHIDDAFENVLSLARKYGSAE